MKTTLLIMAAGIGSRFGTGIKQLEPVDYAFQDINDIPGTLPEGRTKPWGTGQAVLAAKKVIKTPFIVINADDYYGKEGFKAVHEYLVNGGKSCMAGFVLKNTLSDNGGVTRGICKMDEQNNLTEVVETKNIVKTATGAEVDGKVIDVNSLVSMNMWGLTPEFLDVLEEGFKEFFEKEVPGNPLKAEYLIPIFIGELLEQGKMSVKVLKTNDTYILLAACAFVFALLTTQIQKAGKLEVPQSGSELLGIIIYTILLVVAVISNVGMLVMTVSLLKSVRFERLDSGLLLTEGVPDEKDTTAVRFIGRLYVQHTSKNNAVLEKGYTAFNRCVNAFCVSIVALIALAIISIFWGL